MRQYSLTVELLGIQIGHHDVTTNFYDKGDPQKVTKGELLFSSVGPVKLIHGHWLRSSIKMHHILAQYTFEGIFGFVCVGFSKKYL